MGEYSEVVKSVGVMPACGEVVCPAYMERAKNYISQFSNEEIQEIGWKPFDRKKATLATIVSVLKPGKTNTVSISDNKWISPQTELEISEIQQLIVFLRKLLDLGE